MRYFKHIIFILGIAACFTRPASGQEEIGIDEKLGGQIPLNLSFLDENGKPVMLKELVNKPTILTLVYYSCPGICSPLLNGVSSMVDRLDMQMGKDYNIVTISFNPREDYMMASEKKSNYIDHMKKKIPEDSWHFLTGDSASIAQITDAVGFRYKRDGENYIHSAVITVLSPEGKIARYLYGIDFLPLDVKLALTEASEGKTGPTINKFLKFCFSYDPAGRKYVLDVTRIAGAASLAAIIGFIIVLTLKKKKNSVSSPVFNSKGSIQHG